MIKQTVPHHNHYILFFKPYDVLCQFSHEPDRERKTLADYGPFPKNVYPVGRLDADSEGLVLLTDDKQLKHFLLEPRYRHPRTYLVQVERVPTEVDLECLRKGVVIEHRKTLPAEVELLNHEPKIPPRTVPIRFRKNIPTSWLTITLYEGRNRQVRKMTAAVGCPTLRLLRVGMASLRLGELQPGEKRELSTKEIVKLRQIVLRSPKD
jgi:23S rRNA pseudouridine2457 synthase